MRTSRKMSKKAITGGFLLAAAFAAAVPATAANAGTRVTSGHATTQASGHTAGPFTDRQCSNGAVCMYTADPSSGNVAPEHYWTSYGCNNLNNEYGQRWVFNNQYGGHTATLWTGKNCTGQGTTVQEGTTWSGNITPINSISVDN